MQKIKKFKKFESVIEAIQVDFLKIGIKEIDQFLGFQSKVIEIGKTPFLTIDTYDGDLIVYPDDWIIKEHLYDGDIIYHTCKPNIFGKLYSPITKK